MNRHKELSITTPERVSNGRAVISKVYIERWFDELKNNLEKLKVNDVMNNSNRVYNLDETNIQLCPDTGKVVDIRGWKTYMKLLQALKRAH